MFAQDPGLVGPRAPWGRRLSEGVAETRVMARLTVRMTWELYFGAVQLLLDHVERKGS